MTWVVKVLQEMFYKVYELGNVNLEEVYQGRMSYGEQHCSDRV